MKKSSLLFAIAAGLIAAAAYVVVTSGPTTTAAAPVLERDRTASPSGSPTAAPALEAATGRTEAAAAADPGPPQEEPEATAEPAAAPTGVLTGTVVDEQGFTIAGAEVRVWNGRRVRGDPAVTVVSDAGGRFTAQGFGESFIAAAFHEDMVCTRGLRGSLAAGVECVGLELVLGRAHTFEGKVVGAGSVPVEGAVLELSDDLYTSSSLDATDTPGVRSFGSIAGALAERQETGADGRFEFAGVEGGGVSVRVEAVGHVGRWFSHSPAEGPATIPLDPGHVLSGLVLDADGRPAVGAEVRFGPLASNLGVNRSSTTTDEAGRFSVSGIDQEEGPSSTPIFVAALHEGHSAALLQPAALDGGGQGNVLRLERAAPLTGRVVDGEGRPVSGARVWLRSEREYERSYVMVGTPPTWESLFSAFRRTTEDDGRFEFPHRFDGPCSLKVEGPERPRRSVTVAVGADESEVEVRLSDEALDKVVLEGRLVDASSGEPLEAFRLLPWSESEDGSKIAQRADHRSSPDGRFRVAGLDEASLELEFKAEGYASLVLPPRAFEEGVHDLGELKMTPALALRVEVLDEAGEPWTDGKLSLEDAAGKPVQFEMSWGTTTAAFLGDDDVLLEGVPGKPLTAVVKSKGTRWEQPGVDPRAHVGQTLTLVVPRPEVGSLQVTFFMRAALGADPDGFLAGWRQAVATRDQAWFMENQEVVLGAFPKEDLTVQVVRDGVPLASGEVSWVAEAGHYRTATHSEGGGVSSEGAPFPDLRWTQLPCGEVQVVVKTASGAEITWDATVGEPGEEPPPVTIVL